MKWYSSLRSSILTLVPAFLNLLFLTILGDRMGTMRCDESGRALIFMLAAPRLRMLCMSKFARPSSALHVALVSSSCAGAGGEEKEG